MSSETMSDGSISQPPPTRGCTLLELSSSVLELVLQYLPLCEQLNDCSHVSTLFPPPSSLTVRYAPLQLTENSVRHILQSPQLGAVLAGATRVLMHVDTVVRTSRVVQFVKQPSTVDQLFRHVVSLRCTSGRWAPIGSSEQARQAMRDAANGIPGPLEHLFSTSYLHPFLSARSATLRSLHIDIPFNQPAITQFSALLTPLTALRQLSFAGFLSADSIPLLLALPLHVLDLAEVGLSSRTSPALAPIASVAGCELLRSCRILRLPRQEHDNFSPSWRAYLDAIVSQRTDSSLPHTLLVQHSMSAAALQQLLTSPPARSVTINVQGNRTVLSQAATSQQFMLDGTVPRQLSLSVRCGHWSRQSGVQPLTDFVACYHSHVGVLSTLQLPSLEYIAAEVLAAASHCTNLKQLHVSSPLPSEWPGQPWPTPDVAPSQPQWSDSPQLSRLHTLSLTGLRAVEADICRLLSLCSSLRACTLDLHNLSVTMLQVLSSSCPLLSHLQLVLTNECALVTPPADDEPSPSSTPFRSLVQLDVLSRGRTTPDAIPVLMSDAFVRLRPYLAGSPLRLLKLSVPFANAYYQLAVTLLLEALPQLVTLRATSGEWRRIEAAPSKRAWDDDGEDDVEEQRAQQTGMNQTRWPAHSAVTEPNPPLAEQHILSLSTLELLVVPACEPTEHFAALLAHCPAVTSIKLHIHAEDALFTFLRCLASIGQHCPQVQHIAFSLDIRPRVQRAAGPSTVRVFSEDEVRQVVEAYQLPEHAFGCLRHVCKAEDEEQGMSEEAATYVRQQWMSNARADAVFEWHTPPPAPEPVVV